MESFSHPTDEQLLYIFKATIITTCTTELLAVSKSKGAMTDFVVSVVAVIVERGGREREMTT